MSAPRAAIAGFALALLVACGSEDDLERARRIVDDRERFATAMEAGDAMAEVSALLLADARACERDCDARFQAAAHARVLAVRVLGCTAPGRESVRSSMLVLLEAIGTGEGAPAGPSVPECPSAR